MGWLSRLFGDVEGDLERVEQLIRQGEPARAADIAKRAVKADGGRLQKRAEELLVRARRASIEAAVAKAVAIEQKGHVEDAVEWIELGLAYLAETDPATERELGPELHRELERLRGLLSAEAAATLERDLMASALPSPDSEDASSDYEIDLGIDYETLVGTLREDLAARYEDRPEPFQRAVVALSREDPEAALAALSALEGLDAIVRLERGRAHLLAGRFGEARQDFEAAWPELGDQPLDHGGLSSVPLLWAEATLASGDPEAVVERLVERADPATGSPALCESYAQALIACERHDQALDHLTRATQAFPLERVFPLLLASLLTRRGQRAEAVDVLETSIRRRSRSSRAGRLDPSSLEQLARLLLEDPESDSERIHELLNMTTHALGGVSPPVARLRARILRRQGRNAEADAADEVAEQLEAEGRTATPRPPRSDGGQGEPVL